ncbi:MAG: tripartite tricarboxylate transporter substrate binding protein, partial [Rhizobacter sp.]
MQRRNFLTAALAAGSAPWVHAQATLPEGPVRILVGFPPGGGTDVMAR